MLLQYVVLIGFGGAPQRIADPIGLSFNFLGNAYPYYRLVVFLISISLYSIFILFIVNTKYGLWIRAVGQDYYLAKALGIPTNVVFWITFGLGTGFAALSGVLAAPIASVEFKMGLDIMVLAFMAAIIGGFGNLKGTFVASILIGFSEGFLLTILEPSYARIALLVLTIILLVLRPNGLFAVSKTASRI